MKITVLNQLIAQYGKNITFVELNNIISSEKLILNVYLNQ